MSSDLAWAAVTNYFKFLDKFHFPRPLTWNGQTQTFSIVITTPRKILWTLTNFIQFCLFLCIPLTMFTRQLFSDKKIVSNQQAFFLLILFSLGSHYLSCFIKTVQPGGVELAFAMNHLIRLEHHIKENQKRSARDSTTSRIDIQGIALTIVGLSFYVIPIFMAPFLMFGNLDPLYHILAVPTTETSTMFIKLLRFVFTFIAGIECMTFLGSVHLTLMQLTQLLKIAIRNLKYYRPHSSIPIRKTELEIYRILMVINIRAREYTDVVAACIMGCGFGIDVASNYVVIKLYDKIPPLLYFSIVVLAIMTPIVMMGELPQAAASAVECEKLLAYWKTTVKAHQRYRLGLLGLFKEVDFILACFLRLRDPPLPHMLMLFLTIRSALFYLFNF